MLARFQIILISLGLSGCFYMPVLSKGKVSTLDEAPRLATTLSTAEGKAISAYDPTSKVSTTIPAPSGALSGSSVTLPAGALAIAAELVVEEAVPLSQTSVASSLNISADITVRPVGSGLIIRPTEDVPLTGKLTIAMPMDSNAGLRGWLAKGLGLTTGKHYTVFYKYFVNGELKAGAMASRELRFSDTGTVLFDGYFGAYWLAEVSSPILESLEQPTTEPIVNKDNVAVVTSTGVVTETEVVARTAIPPVQWLSVGLSLDTVQRTVKASATIAAGRSLSSCQVDLFEKTDASSGLNIAADATLSVFHKISKQEAHALHARYRCLDDQGRQTMSPWSAAVSVPGFAPAPVVTQPTTDFCASNAPALRLVNTDHTIAGGVATRNFTALGNCVFSIEMDTLWGSGFAIMSGDEQTRCFTHATPYLGEQTLTCVASNDASPTMWMPQGNYTIRMDFSASSAKDPEFPAAILP